MPAASPTAFAQSDDNYKVDGEIAAYLGVMPAAIVGEHAAGLALGASMGKHGHRIVISLFDKPSGRRIENAEVTAYVSGLAHVGGTRLILEPMLTADVVT